VSQNGEVFRFGIHYRRMPGDADGVEIWRGGEKLCGLPGGIGLGILLQAAVMRRHGGFRESDYLQGVLDGLTLPRPNVSAEAPTEKKADAAG
jgi:hypothetical protein